MIGWLKSENTKKTSKQWRVENLGTFRSTPEAKFKSRVKARARDYEFGRLMQLKTKQERKMGQLHYSKLGMQEYLKMENMQKETAETIFK